MIQKLFNKLGCTKSKDIHSVSSMFIGILSNRDKDEMDEMYLKVHLSDHTDLMKRMVSLDETTLSLELIETYIE